MAFVGKIFVLLLAFEVSTVIGANGTSEIVDTTSFIYDILSAVLQQFNETKTISLDSYSTTNTNLTYNATFQDGVLVLPTYIKSTESELTGNSSEGFNGSAVIYTPDFFVNYTTSEMFTENETFSGPISINIEDITMDAFFEISSVNNNYSLTYLQVTPRPLVGAQDLSIDYGYNLTDSILEDVSDVLLDYSSNNVTNLLASLISTNINDTLQSINLVDYITTVNNTDF